MQQFTRIKGLSEIRRLPRLGKIRLGVKAKTKAGKEYPVDVPYFIVPPEVAKVYGDKPTQLEVMFPVNDANIIFPQALKYYGASRGLKCIGNGERAMRMNEQTRVMEPIECPCPLLDNGCSKRAHLMVILPKITVGGVYQIDTGSFNSMVDINSGLDYLLASVGRIAFVEVLLKRQPKDTFFEGHRRKHYPLMIDLATTDIAWLNAVRAENTRIVERTASIALPPPTEENPALDEGGVVVPEEELAQAGVLVEGSGPGEASVPQQGLQPSPAPPAKTEEAARPAPASRTATPAPQQAGPVHQVPDVPHVTGVVKEYWPRPEAASGKKAPPGKLVLQTETEQVIGFRFWTNPESLRLGKAAVGQRCTVHYTEQQSSIGALENWIAAFALEAEAAPVPIPSGQHGSGNGAGPAAPPTNGAGGSEKTGPRPMTMAQEQTIRKLAGAHGIPEAHITTTITGMKSAEASRLITVIEKGDLAVFQLAASCGDEETY